jgi:hypothetical protein
VHYAFDANRRFYAVARRRYHSARTLRQRVLALVFVTALALYAVLLIAAAAGWLDWTGHAPPRGLAVILLGFSLLPALLRLYSATRKVHCRTTVTPGPSGVEVHTGNAGALVDWQEFIRAVRFPDGILLLQRGLYRWLPDAALHGSTPLDVVELLRSKVPVEMHA